MASYWKPFRNLKFQSAISPYVTLFGKTRLNEISVEPFLHLNAFSNVENALEIIFNAFQNVGNVPQRNRNTLKTISKSLQNVCNALSNIDNAFPRNSLALRIIHTLCLLTFCLKLKTKCNSKNAVVIVIWENTKLFRFTRSGSN